LSLRTEISTPEGKQRYVRRLFATIADRYDFITVFLSWGQDRRWKRRLIDLAGLTTSDRVLDLACGTGDLVYAACPPAGSAVGMDVTFRMIELAVRKRRCGTRFVVGDMHTLPFVAGRFDVVTTGYGLRNVSDLTKAVGEIHRVLAPGGRFLSLDFNRPRNPVARVAFVSYLTVVGSALGWALHRDPDTYRYIPESIRRYPGAEGVAQLLSREGFVGVRSIRVLGGLMAIHVARKVS
jgi:demethylmenaquinone methyltransferase/2-methoxy-6-polyprenyl-1,4-benzoquinol methylase